MAPSPIRDVVMFVVLSVPPPPEMTGALSPDSSESLADAEILFPDVLVGAECLAWDDDGELNILC